MVEPCFFSTGMARSGTNLLSKIISAHDDLHLVIGSNIETYRLARDLILQQASTAFTRAVPPRSSFSDFFGEEIFYDVMQHLFSSDFDIEVPNSYRKAFIEASRSRFPNDSPDLMNIFEYLVSSNIKELIREFADAVVSKRKLNSNIKLGFHESWHIEMLPALQHSFPSAKFIIMLRDVRGSFSSHKSDTESQKKYRVSLLEYAKQFRKYAALSFHFAKNYDNVHVLKYENLMEDPETEIKNICKFLDVDFDLDMLSPEKHIEQSTGNVWKGNSGYGNPVSGFSPNRNIKWSKNLTKKEIELLEILCWRGLEHYQYDINYNLTEIPNHLLDYLRDQTSKSERWGVQTFTRELAIRKEQQYFSESRLLSISESKLFCKKFFSPEYYYYI